MVVSRPAAKFQLKPKGKFQPAPKFSAFKATSNGKAAGKAAGSSARTRIIHSRVTGRISAWKGRFGWIIPDQPLRHPKANANNGKIFLSEKDVEEELDGVGARVKFFVYADAQGIGAMNCVPVKGPNAMPAFKAQREITTPKLVVEREITSSRTKALKETSSQRSKLQGAAPTSRVFAPKAGQNRVMKAMPKHRLKQQGKKQQPGALPDKASRKTLGQDLLQGVVVTANEKVGFIKTDEVADLCEGRKRLYFHMTDVDGDAPLLGAQVYFLAYKDIHGFGAENVQVIVQGDGQPPPKDDSDPAESIEPSARRRPGKTQREAQKSLRMRPKAKSRETKKEKSLSGPELPRERVVEEQVIGEVIEWRRGFGWIKPSVDIDHPEAEKHKGNIYVHHNDIVGADSFSKGDTVQFYVFADASGLGAEEASVV